jgi:hypothetical protein
MKYSGRSTAPHPHSIVPRHRNSLPLLQFLKSLVDFTVSLTVMTSRLMTLHSD